MTGRDDELALLLDAAQRSRSERKAILFTVMGAPGVGKSRLAREFGARVAADGTSVIRGRCLPYGEGITYWPLAEMLRQVAKITPEMTGPEALERVHAISPDEAVADRLAFAIGLRADAPVAGEGIDREIAWAFRRLFETYPIGGPMVLVFEDIHWAEPVLLDLIEYLIAFVRDVPALVLCLSRPELLDQRPTWGAGRVESTRILLEPLKPEESASLLSALLAVQDLPEPLVRRVLERSEGNPLFVEEVVRMLIDEGVVERQGERWVATATAAEVRVPETVEALIRARLDTLPRPERTLLQSASVVGRIFQHSAVAAIQDDGQDLRPHLEDAVLRDLISEERTPDPEPTYRFKHILIRDVAYASLPKARRADLHTRVADWLAAWAGERLSEFLEIQAYHLEQAVLLQRELEGRADEGLMDRSVDALEQSARAALAREDFGAAERFAARAVEIVDPSHARRLDAEALLLEALYRQNDYRRMSELGTRIAVAAAEAGRLDLEGRGLLAQAMGLWLSLERPDSAQAITLLERARGLLERAGDRAHLVDAVMNIGFGGWAAGDLDEAARRWQEAADLAHAANDPGREALAILMVMRARRFQGDRASRPALLTQAIQLAEESGSALTKARAARAEGVFVAETTSLERGLEKIMATLPAFEEAMDREESAAVLDTSAKFEVHLGRPAEALELFHRAIAVLEETGHSGFLPEAERGLAEALLDLGRISEAEQHALRAAEIVAPWDVSTIANTGMVLGRVRDLQGRDEEAEELLREAVRVTEGTQYRSSSWEEYLALAEFLARRGRVAESEAALATARERALLLGPQSPILEVIERRAAAARAAASS
jgi:predicted ATPase